MLIEFASATTIMVGAGYLMLRHILRTNAAYRSDSKEREAAYLYVISNHIAHSTIALNANTEATQALTVEVRRHHGDN